MRMKEEIEAESSDSNSTTAQIRAKFKGVVPQQNGHWGAQIYANHQRVWLGTFRTQIDAAMAYDSASMKLRSGDYSNRNFPLNNTTIDESNFQTNYTTESVLDMIKDGSYRSKFAYYLSTRSENPNIGRIGAAKMQYCNGGIMYRQMFRKELTPSDVSKLNRLVIPKKYAVKYLPPISQNEEEKVRNSELQLVFYDSLMKSWKFRYCYWNSSQSFVFTKGWNRFVREKELKESDTIVFYTCEYCCQEGEKSPKYCMIDVNKRGSSNGGSVEIAENEKKVEEKAGKGFKLFGVQITPIQID